MAATVDYPREREHLSGLLEQLTDELPGPMSAFGQLYEAVVTEEALSTRVKELIAVGIAIAARCDGCIAYHVHGALTAGATRQEVLEVVGVAVLMGGGPAVMYGARVLEAVDQFTAEAGASG